MKKMVNSSKGFTLVELLAVITIIGILLAFSITAVVHYIDKAKVDQKKQQEKTVTMAAKSYFQDNRNKLPKVVGETSTISLNVLRESKYLTEDIKDANGASCMENSYVKVSKESTTKYIYKTSLYCGNDEVPEGE